MNYQITSDTHLGHDRLCELTHRPANFSDMILKRHAAALNPGDVLIHLGDICIGHDAIWHEQLLAHAGPKWLIKGNHDRRSNTWYLSHGWDFVADAIVMNIFGKKILFSHRPQDCFGYDLNIHGHVHARDIEPMSDKHRLIIMEHGYTPFNLRRVVQ